MRNYIIIPILFIFACGGTDGNPGSVFNAGVTEVDGGSASSAGFENAGGSFNDAGEPDTGSITAGGTGGVTATGGTGGINVDAGFAFDAGVDGDVNVGGSGGTAGSGSCVPKTCVTLAVELSGGDLNAESCGVVFDGCGNYLDCGGCLDLHQGCGEGEVTGVDFGIPLRAITEEGIANICGGGCTRIQGATCSDTSGLWVCYGDAQLEVNTQPAKVCEPGGNINNDYTTWCCG